MLRPPVMWSQQLSVLHGMTNSVTSKIYRAQQAYNTLMFQKLYLFRTLWIIIQSNLWIRLNKCKPFSGNLTETNPKSVNEQSAHAHQDNIRKGSYG